MPEVKSALAQMGSSLKCMVRRLTAREKRRVGRQVCANVFVNKGEDVVKDKCVLDVA
jgi:hypothetical protein